MMSVGYGTGSLLLATLLYGFVGILSRILGFQLPLYFQTWTRDAAVVMVFLLIICVKKQTIKFKIKDWPIFLIRGTCNLLSIVAIYISFNFLQISTAYFVFYVASTVSGYFIGWRLFKEKIDRIKIGSLSLSFVGLYLIFRFAIPQDKEVYLLYALLSGIATGVWNTFSKKVSQDYSLEQINFLDNLIAACIAFLISLFLQERWSVPSVSAPWIANTILGAIWVGTGYLIVYGFKRVDAAVGSVIMLAEILFGSLYSVFFFQEFPQRTALAGGALILLAIILPIFPQFGKKEFKKTHEK
ncbi:DMT family transporter [Candidatus Roizmanbacteria bacterium]|nr:DMT family transporter [Candidatus Roizmanbacteria bacterium]